MPRRLILTVLLAALSPLAQGEESEDVRILRGLVADSRRQFETKLASETASTHQAFLSKLRRFERIAADSSDYTQAIVYRDRKRALSEMTERHDPRTLEKRAALAIPLSLSSASLAGAVFLQQDVLKGWKSSATAATWNLRGLAPGRYEVVVSYSCSEATEEKSTNAGKKLLLKAGGQFSLGEASRLLREDTPSLIHQVLPTKNWDTYRDVSLGELTLANAAVSLRLDVIEANPLGLMNLKSVDLYPLPEKPKSPPLPQPEEIRRSFQAAIDRRQEKLRAAYLEDLRALQQRAAAASDTSLEKEIQTALDAPPRF